MLAYSNNEEKGTFSLCFLNVYIVFDFEDGPRERHRKLKL